MFSKGRGLESIKEDDKATKKSVAFRQSGHAQISGHVGNQDIKAELSSIASSTTTEAMQDKRDDFIKKGLSLTFRDAAHFIMNSLNEVSKRLGINPLIEPVVENATKAVQQDLYKQHGNAAGGADPVVQYSKMMVKKF